MNRPSPFRRRLTIMLIPAALSLGLPAVLAQTPPATPPGATAPATPALPAAPTPPGTAAPATPAPPPAEVQTPASPAAEAPKPSATAPVQTADPFGEETTLTATLGTYSDKTTDTNKAPTPPSQDDQSAVQSSVGLTLVPNSNGDGVLIQDVDQNSVAADKGFQVGDAILEVDNKKVTTGKEFEDAIKAIKDSGRGTALIKAERDGNVRFIGLPLTTSNG